MAKSFTGLSERNNNMKRGKDLLFSKNTEELHTDQDNPDTSKKKVEDDVKFFNIPLPAEWHRKLKYDLAKDTGMSLKELILDAISKTYKF